MPKAPPVHRVPLVVKARKAPSVPMDRPVLPVLQGVTGATGVGAQGQAGTGGATRCCRCYWWVGCNRAPPVPSDLPDRKEQRVYKALRDSKESQDSKELTGLQGSNGSTRRYYGIPRNHGIPRSNWGFQGATGLQGVTGAHAPGNSVTTASPSGAQAQLPPRPRIRRTPCLAGGTAGVTITVPEPDHKRSLWTSGGECTNPGSSAVSQTCSVSFEVNAGATNGGTLVQGASLGNSWTAAMAFKHDCCYPDRQRRPSSFPHRWIDVHDYRIGGRRRHFVERPA